MLDFLRISSRSPKRGVVEIFPTFIVKKSHDLMTRGGDFYAIWDDSAKLWSTDEFKAIELIDREIEAYYNDYIQNCQTGDVIKALYLWNYDTGQADKWHRYLQKGLRDFYVPLDETIIFSNQETTRETYASVKLPYSLEDSGHEAWDSLVSVLYSDTERHKIEWIIGAIAKGDSKKLQKFVVFYGSGGTGKSTILNIIDKMFEGYTTSFDAKALASANNTFSLEPFNSNPLIAIDHDSNLSRIEDNTKLNSLVSHERMTVNEKHKKLYQQAFNCILLIGSNSPVKITDAKSGLIRRLIDISPTGEKIPRKKYDKLLNDIMFELGGIVKYCMGVYEEDPNYYNDYIPVSMLSSTNHMYDFISDEFNTFDNTDGITLASAYDLYKKYCESANIAYPMNRLTFKEELKNYFESFEERDYIDGQRIRNYYSNFLVDKFKPKESSAGEQQPSDWIIFEDFKDGKVSQFDVECWECPTQYATNDKPRKKWSEVTTTLKDIQPNKTHFVRVPENHIVIDFDLKDADGNKSLELNLKAANKWKPTYCEVSKGGNGLHLHYIYTGDPEQLERIYAKDIEIKVFKGSSALRRRLSKFNDLPISIISSGLPISRKEKKLLNEKTVKDERELKAKINKALIKGYDSLPGTKTNIDFIDYILNQAYDAGVAYDLTTMRPAIMNFAANSTNHAQYCLKVVSNMKFKSETEDIAAEFPKDAPVVIFDCEVMPNLFVICWKKKGPKEKIVRMINPSWEEVEKLFKMRLRGFNNRRYDNHILYAASEGHSKAELFTLSQRIIDKSPNAFLGPAWNLSDYDIYDGASAGNKKGLKKYEIEINSLMKMPEPDETKNPGLYSKWKKVQDIKERYGITELKHQELDIPWDKEVPEELWNKVADYCCNDVLATEIVDEYLEADYICRKILVDIVNAVHPDMKPSVTNDTTNSLSTRLIFGDNKNPQDEFCYWDLSQPVEKLDTEIYNFLSEVGEEFIHEPNGFIPKWKKDSRPSILPYFPDYIFEDGKSTYRGYEVGEGGLVWAKPGIYRRVKTFDIVSMHPSSAKALCLFGPHYTRIFVNLLQARVYIKHKDWESLSKMFDGIFISYIKEIEDGIISAKDLSNALKTVINSVYGLTAAGFDNPFKDKRNVDNIVAKRGALFMVDLLEACLEKGWNVIHIKTDSIKIADCTDEVEDYILKFGKRYGYEFEIESEYEKICLVNDAVYVAKDTDGLWTATGKQFQVPYVFKTLFTHEEVNNYDLMEVFNVQTSLYLDFNENLKEDEHDYRFVGRTGAFYPIRPGMGGGELFRRSSEDKYGYASGSKGYRWKETEVLNTIEAYEQIDMEYWDAKVREAIKSISQFEGCDNFFDEIPENVTKEVA